MIIDDFFLTKLSDEAKKDIRLRKNYDLRNSQSDFSQRMLNAVEPGTIMPIHRHVSTSTTVIILKGRIKQNFFDDDGKLTESVILDSDTKVKAVQIEKGRWHNLESLEPGSVIFEAKDGIWEPYELFNNKI